jgi:hypothetical protein
MCTAVQSGSTLALLSTQDTPSLTATATHIHITHHTSHITRPSSHPTQDTTGGTTSNQPATGGARRRRWTSQEDKQLISLMMGPLGSSGRKGGTPNWTGIGKEIKPLPRTCKQVGLRRAAHTA